MCEPLLLSRRLSPALAAAQTGAAKAEPHHHDTGSTPSAPSAAAEAREDATPLLVLALSAAERQRLRGHCRSACGRDLLLQLPRGGGPLQPQERLGGDDGVARVQVQAAPEELLLARSDDPFTLLRAAYHLGNRHVALELRQGELRLLQDPVLADLLRGLGVSLEAITAPFEPESGAYALGHAHEPEGEPSGTARHHGHGAGSRQEEPGAHHHPHRH